MSSTAAHWPIRWRTAAAGAWMRTSTSYAAWMGWVMFAFGLACLAGPIGFFGVLATMLWVLVAGIWMVKQGPPVPERVTPLAEHHVTV
jgi:hypothetical protein